MSKYQKGKIYKLVSNYTDEIYIGSTIQPLNKRISQHRENRNDCASKKLTELGEIKIILIENFPCESKEELLKRERFYFDSMDCLNKHRPITTETERKELMNKRDKKYKEKNREKINETGKKRYDRKKDEINARRRLYRLKNKDKIKIKIICDCGAELNKYGLIKHKKTKKHITYINSLN
jgi:hypothetical protein